MLGHRLVSFLPWVIITEFENRPADFSRSSASNRPDTHIAQWSHGKKIPPQAFKVVRDWRVIGVTDDVQTTSRSAVDVKVAVDDIHNLRER